MRRAAVLAGAMLLSPFGAFFGQNAPPKTSRIVGTVVDSVRGVVLQGAEVMVSGLASIVMTDSLGRFAVEGIAPGTYEVGVFHPVIEALGLTLTTKPFVLGRDSTGIANLAIPSGKSLASRFCRNELASVGPVIAGRVRDPDTDKPVFGATVSLAWVDISTSGRNRMVTTSHRLQTEADSAGFFKFCGLPEDLDGTVTASHLGVSTGEVPVITSGNPLTFENLTIAPPIAPPRLFPTRGFVGGTVFSVDDKPLEGARVEAQPSRVSNVTKSDGTFSLGEVPIGTQLLVVSHVGFLPVRVSVNVTSRQPTDIRVTLAPNINIKDPAMVPVGQNYALDWRARSSRWH
jgi:hypothetical protein